MTADDREPDDTLEPETARPGPDVRRVAQWVIVAGVVLGLAAAAFLVWEAWSANRAALDHNRAGAGEADVYPIDGSGGAAPSDPGPPAGPYRETSEPPTG